ncbi:hypothetical protein, partial [Metapseudomonas furukawaii]|uniref:hypothetical protein n=1 Tax=Metapseudomonas furukawaii TaxID=1149133 RepID=UPI001ED9A36B
RLAGEGCGNVREQARSYDHAESKKRRFPAEGKAAFSLWALRTRAGILLFRAAQADTRKAQLARNTSSSSSREVTVLTSAS